MFSFRVVKQPYAADAHVKRSKVNGPYGYAQFRLHSARYRATYRVPNDLLTKVLHAKPDPCIFQMKWAAGSRWPFAGTRSRTLFRFRSLCWASTWPCSRPSCRSDFRFRRIRCRRRKCSWTCQGRSRICKYFLHT